MNATNTSNHEEALRTRWCSIQQSKALSPALAAKATPNWPKAPTSLNNACAAAHNVRYYIDKAN